MLAKINIDVVVLSFISDPSSIHGQALQFRELCPEICGICHVNGDCSATNNDVAFAAHAKAQSFVSTVDDCSSVSKALCDPSNSVGKGLKYRELCPASCEICHVDVLNRAWVSATYNGVLSADCERDVLSSATLQFRVRATTLPPPSTKLHSAR